MTRKQKEAWEVNAHVDKALLAVVLSSPVLGAAWSCRGVDINATTQGMLVGYNGVLLKQLGLVHRPALHTRSP